MLIKTCFKAEKGHAVKDSVAYLETIMNTLLLVLEGVLLVSCFLQSVEGFTPWIKPQGDMSSISNRQIKVKKLKINLIILIFSRVQI